MVSILNIIPKILAFPSFLGSLYIFITILRKYIKKNETSTYTRLIGAMSFFDLFTSAAFFCGAWPIPYGSATEGASGNDLTCTVQGFFIQMLMCIVFYNFFLAIYYLLVVGYGWKDRQIIKIEPYMHAFSILYGLGTSIAGIVLDLYNDSNLWCWIAQAENYVTYRMAFLYIPLWGCTIGITICMVGLVRSVRNIERKASKWSKREKSLSKQVAWQGFWYVMAFYLTFIFASVTRIVQMITGNAPPYALLVLFAISAPGQGLWNFLVYMRPRYLLYLKNNPRAGSMFFCCGSWCDQEGEILTNDHKNINNSTNNNYSTKSLAISRCTNENISAMMEERIIQYEAETLDALSSKPNIISITSNDTDVEKGEEHKEEIDDVNRAERIIDEIYSNEPGVESGKSSKSDNISHYTNDNDNARLADRFIEHEEEIDDVDQDETTTAETYSDELVAKPADDKKKTLLSNFKLGGNRRNMLSKSQSLWSLKPEVEDEVLDNPATALSNSDRPLRRI